MTKWLKTKRKIWHWTDRRWQWRKTKVEKTKRVATGTAARASGASEREWRLLQLGSKKYRAGGKKKKWK
jgi:hypothetical protein